jgi:cytochrome P450
MAKQIQDLIDDRNQGYKDASHPTVFKELLDSDLSPKDKNLHRLKDEGVTLVGAGQETVKAALQVGTYYLLRSPEIFYKLRDELLTVYPNPAEPPPLPVLEQLPYLTAVINECTPASPIIICPITPSTVYLLVHVYCFLPHISYTLPSTFYCTRLITPTHPSLHPF